MTFKDFLTLSLGISGCLIGQLLNNYLDLCQKQFTSPQILILIGELLAGAKVVISSLEDAKMERVLIKYKSRKLLLLNKMTEIVK